MPASPPMSGFDALMKNSQAQAYWLRRVVAFFIDVAIVYVALTILALLVATPLLLLSGPGAFSAVFGGVFSIVSGLVLFLYFVVLEVSTGSSIGKRLLGLKVVAGGTRMPNATEAALRNLSKIYWLLLLLDVLVGLATSKEYTMKYSDSFAHTAVI